MDAREVRKDFPILDQEVNGQPLSYLDNAATSQKPRQVITELKHHSNIVSWQLACRDTGATLRAIPVEDGATLDLDAFDRMLSNRTRIVAVGHISNVLGTINPIARIAEKAHDAGAIVVCDGAQAAPHLPVDVGALGCDFYVGTGHKMCAPTGIGFLWGREARSEERRVGKEGRGRWAGGPCTVRQQ